MDQIYLVKLYGKLVQNPIYNPTQKSIFAKVSLRWINHVSQYKWYLGQNGYPFAYIKYQNQTSRINLHRYIHWLQTAQWTNLYVDHINRDKLDSTDSNLREATPAQNSYNKTHTNPNHNIKLNKSTSTYEVNICKNKINHKINNIQTLEEAKDIYKLMSEELFGEFAS